MLEIDDVIVEQGIKKLGASVICVYLYIKKKSKGVFERFLIKDFINVLGFSKPMIINYIKKLRKFKLIKIKVRIERGKKTLYLKSLKTGKEILPLSSIEDIYINNNINNKSKNINIDIKYKEIFKKIIERALSFPRYNNSYYKNREWKFGKKEEKHIRNLLKNVDDPVNYMEWWLKNKARKMPGLNMGLICCIPMIEEYLIKKGKPLDKIEETRETNTIYREKIQEKKKQIVREFYKELMESQKNDERYELGETDRKLLEQSLQKKWLIKKEGKLFLNI